MAEQPDPATRISRIYLHHLTMDRRRRSLSVTGFSLSATTTSRMGIPSGKRIDVRKFSVRWWSDWSWQERRRREFLGSVERRESSTWHLTSSA